MWARRLERVCGGREDIAFLLRRVVGDEGVVGIVRTPAILTASAHCPP